MLLSLDMSMRSSGVVVLDEDNNMYHFEVIKTDAKQFPYDVDLMIYISGRIMDIIEAYDVTEFVIEGLSLNSKSAKKDVIAGIYWVLITMVTINYPEILIGSIPVKSWRTHLRTKDEWSWFKKNCRDALKNGVFTLLPEDIKRQFLLYVEANGMKIESVFDLTDAYFLGIYRNSLK